MPSACSALTRKGLPCKAAPLKGGEFCRAHDPQLPAESRFGSPEQAREAATGVERRVPRLTELKRKWVEDNAERLIEKLDELLDANRGLAVGNGKDARVEIVPDPSIQFRALQDIFDRAEGKPRQALELTGEDGGPIQTSGIDLSGLTGDELRALRELLGKAGA